MTTTDNLNSIRAKIAALLAKAEGTDNAHEAAAFMGKVNELLERYQIDITEIGNSADPMGHQDGEFNVYASMMWAKILIHNVALYYNARSLWMPKRKNHLPYKIIGRESCRMTAELMIPFIISQVRQQAKELVKQGMTASIAQREVAHALTQRIASALHARQDQNKSIGNGRELIIVDQTEAYMISEFKSKAGKNVKMRYGASAQELAAKISLNHQATGRHTKLIG